MDLAENREAQRCGRHADSAGCGCSSRGLGEDVSHALSAVHCSTLALVEGRLPGVKRLSTHFWPLGGKTLVKLMPLALGAVFIVMGIILTVAVTGCTHTQQTVGGAAAGGVAGAVVAGPIGAAVGAGAGAVTAPIITNR